MGKLAAFKKDVKYKIETMVADNKKWAEYETETKKIKRA